MVASRRIRPPMCAGCRAKVSGWRKACSRNVPRGRQTLVNNIYFRLPPIESVGPYWTRTGSETATVCWGWISSRRFSSARECPGDRSGTDGIGRSGIAGSAWAAACCSTGTRLLYGNHRSHPGMNAALETVDPGEQSCDLHSATWRHYGCSRWWDARCRRG